jgi:hypothetical protein
MEELSDEDLVAHYRTERGSPLAASRIDELFRRHRTRVATWCFRLTGEVDSATDLAQDVLLKAFQRLDAFRGDSRFTTWLYSIARNHCMDCTFTAAGEVQVSATFTTVHTLSIGRGGNGTVSGTPNGEFGTSINCGGNCSAKFQEGATVTLTATPAAGLKFTGWAGACSGSTPTCSVTIAGDTKVQANFK